MGDIGQQTAVAFDDVVKREEQTLGAVVALAAYAFSFLQSFFFVHDKLPFYRFLSVGYEVFVGGIEMSVAEETPVCR